MENNRRRWKKWLWKVMLWGCFGGICLTGCGQSRLEAGVDSMIEEEVEGEVYLDSICESEITVQQEIDLGEEIEELTGEAKLKKLLKCEKFAICVWHSIDIEDKDTKETILQKMEQCEFLLLKDYRSEEEGFSLEDLRFFPNLKRLQIEFDKWESEIEDFTPIAELSQLEELYLSYHTGEEIDLSFLGGMKSITELYLPECQITDFTFLEEMPQLEKLSLYYTPIADLRILEKLPRLVELALAGNSEAKYIETVGKLTKMQDLGLQDCGIEEIGFLSGLTELRGVNLNENAITDLTPLAGLTKLERLGAAINQISDIRPLEHLTNLFDLALDQNQISDISVLAGLSHLNQVGLSDNQIGDFSPLADKEELMWVSVFGNPCKEFQVVWTVPFFSYGRNGVSEEQQAVVDNWMAEHRADIKEYECIDYTEGDLNQDGLMDAAFVVNGDFCDGDSDYAEDNDRRLFIILQQEDGSWKESEERLSVMDSYAGGMRGDPHLGLFMGDGYLVQEEGYGSRMGAWTMNVYEYQDGKLKDIFGKVISDDRATGETEVRVVMDKEDGESIVDEYKVEIKDYRYIRIYE